MFSKQNAQRIGALVVTSMLAGGAMAQTAFTVPTEVADAKAAVLLVGAAVFGIAVALKLYKWIKRAL